MLREERKARDGKVSVRSLDPLRELARPVVLEPYNRKSCPFATVPFVGL